MKTISIAFILITWTAVQSESPPRANYYHSSYDDISYQEELPSLYPTQESHGHAHAHAHSHTHEHAHHPHSHSHSHGHSPSHGHAHAHSHGPVQHEVIVQHHHYAPPSHASRVVSHGTPEPPHYPTHTHKSRGHYPSHNAHSHSLPVKSAASAYQLPAKEAVESPGLYAGYSSVKANDYKAYSMHTPASHSDDYGIEAYTPAHSADYGTPNTYHNLPSYKGSALSYAPPGDASAGSYGGLTQSHALASYQVEPQLESAYSRPKTTKGHRTHSYSSAYAPSVKSPSYSKGLQSYGAPKTIAYPSTNSYTSPKYTTLYATKPAYTQTKTVGYTVGSGLEKMKSYFRSPSTKSAYGQPSQYSNYAQQAAPQYSYGSPASKGPSYTYAQAYEKPLGDKGYVRFADETYGAQTSPYEEDGTDSTLVTQGGADETESYGGGYDQGTAHY